jgi:arylsulfatase A-like enzyme
MVDPHSMCDPPFDPLTAQWSAVAADRGFDPAWSLEYDREIRYMDTELGRLFRHLAPRLDPSRTIMAVVADHGEELGDSGVRGHSTNLHNAVVRVPLIIRYPDQQAAVESRPFSLQQLRSTLLHAVDPNLPAPLFGWPLAAHVVPPGEGHRTMRSLQQGSWKYVATYESERLAEEALYRLPDEQTNRIASYRSLASELRAQLPDVPMQANPKLTPEAIEKLRSLSYIH